MAVKKFNKMVNPEKIKGDTRYGDLYKPHGNLVLPYDAILLPSSQMDVPHTLDMQRNRSRRRQLFLAMISQPQAWSTRLRPPQ